MNKDKQLVGVKFCGNCNPHIDTARLFTKLQQRAARSIFVSPPAPHIDILLILSGCEKDCATRPAIPVPTVASAGATIDGWPYPPELLAEKILQQLEKS